MSAQRQTISEIKKLTNSLSGNPRYRLSFTDGTSGVTKADAGWVYEISPGNRRAGEGAEVDVVLQGDRITMLSFIES